MHASARQDSPSCSKRNVPCVTNSSAKMREFCRADAACRTHFEVPPPLKKRPHGKFCGSVRKKWKIFGYLPIRKLLQSGCGTRRIFLGTSIRASSFCKYFFYFYYSAGLVCCQTSTQSSTQNHLQSSVFSGDAHEGPRVFLCSPGISAGTDLTISHMFLKL